MKIAILVEGETEEAFFPFLSNFLKQRVPRMPKLVPISSDGRLPKGAQLKRQVERLLTKGNPPADYVIALTDIYTGTANPRDFEDAADAKHKNVRMGWQ